VIVRLIAIALKELRQLRRDRLTFAMMAVLPMMQLMLFGYAINTDVRNMPTVILDRDHSRASRDLAASLRATGYYNLQGEVSSYEAAEARLRTGESKVVLVVPRRYGADLAAGKKTDLQLIVDGSDPQTVGSATNTAASLVAGRAEEALVGRLARLGLGREVSLRLEASVWYNPELKTSTFIVPGLVGVILTMTMVMMTSMAIARERERGTLEQLVVSPVKSFELMLGKITPYVGIGLVQMSLILLAGRLIFDVRVIGSLPLLYGAALLFISANLGIGLVFSTLAKTQQQAMQMSFFFLLPNILLSGFMFPFEAMPRPAQLLSEALPLTHFHRIVRGISLKGADFFDLRSEFVALLLGLIAFLTIASFRFSKKLG
jgi:ABC-2 type transport system permease protein